MAYGIVYECTFDDDNSDTVVIYVMQEGFNSANKTVVLGGANPCKITMLGEGEAKYTHFKATEAKLEFISSTSLQYLSLFLATNKTYLVKVIKNGDVKWYGWVNPEYYSEPFRYPPYPTTISATDGIALLKNVPFPILAAEVTTYKRSVIDYVATCLTQIGFPDTMRIKVACNLGMLTTDGYETTRLFEKAFLDYRAMRDEEPLWSCYKVLEEILKTFNARLYQWQNTWWIEKVDQKHAAYDVDVYDMDGLYVSTTSSFDDVVTLTANLGRGSTIRFMNGCNLEVQPAYRGYSINHEWGNRTNILKSTNFDGAFYDDDFVGDAALKFWDADQGSQEAILKKVELENENAVLMRPINYPIGQVPAFTAYIIPVESGSPLSRFVWTYNEGSTNEDALVAWQAGLGVCYFKFKAFASWAVYYNVAPYIKSFIRIKINCSGNIYTAWFDIGDLDNYEWVKSGDSPVTYSLEHTDMIVPKGEWLDASIALTIPEPEITTPQTYIGFQIEISSPNLNDATMTDPEDGILYKDVQLYFVEGTESTVTNKEGVASRWIPEKKQVVKYELKTDYVIDTDNLLEPEIYDVKYAESPAPFDTDGYGLVNRYVIFDSDSNAINCFNVGSVGLTRVISDELETSYQRPVFKLRGSLIDTVGSQVNFYTCLKDYDSRYYVWTGAEYDVKQSVWTGEWLQIWDESGSGEFSDDFNEDFLI